MKDHNEMLRKAIAILDDVNARLKALYFEHKEDQAHIDASMKKAA